MHSGCKYGHLTVISEVRAANLDGLWFTVKCDCGILSQKRAKYVKSGRVKTCGTCQLSRRLMASRGTPKVWGEKADHLLYNRATTRGTTAGLPYETYITRIKENCACCGSAPSQKFSGVHGLYNSVVRGKTTQVDTDDSVMTVCGICRRRIGVQNPWEFLDYLLKCAVHLNRLLDLSDKDN